MTTIDMGQPQNDRYRVQKPGPNNKAPKPDIIGAVEFLLEPDETQTRLSLKIKDTTVQLDEENRLVGEYNGEFYIRVPYGKVVQIDFKLGGKWEWAFANGGGVTLADEGHKNRYWITDSSTTKMRQLVIKHSGKKPPAKPTDDKGQNDEKFNLEVEFLQIKGKPLKIEIDPITKNPPPVGGRKSTLGEAGSLL
jgi:hypothetical protein